MGTTEGTNVERYEITGRVQGVGFRYWTLRTARSLGVRGTVRNRSDGAVVVVAAGDAQALAALRESLQSGPAGARVREVRSLPAGEDEESLPTGFEIVH